MAHTDGHTWSTLLNPWHPIQISSCPESNSVPEIHWNFQWPTEMSTDMVKEVNFIFTTNVWFMHQQYSEIQHSPWKYIRQSQKLIPKYFSLPGSLIFHRTCILHNSLDSYTGPGHGHNQLRGKKHREVLQLLWTSCRNWIFFFVVLKNILKTWWPWEKVSAFLNQIKFKQIQSEAFKDHWYLIH